MLIEKRLLLLWLFAIAPFLLYSQEYCGKVYDTQKKAPLGFASISILSADSTIIAYAHTADDGSFCLSGKADRPGSFIAVSFIGYKQEVININHFTEGMTINLNPTEIALREVRVNTRRLYRKGDTLTYSVSGFKAQQDVSIADVLRRMPGLEVSESGGVKYQGVAINKLYIEGLDLLEERYNLASKNLRADYIEEVQIMENHEPINSLRDKTFNEQAAVNLVLKDEVKQSWLATLDLGAGASPFLWNNRIMGMAFNRNSQQLNMYKNDNTGENLGQETIPSITNIVKASERRNLFGSLEQQLLSPISYPNPPVNEKRYRFNNEHMISTNHLHRIGENKDLKYTVSYLNSRTEYKNQTQLNHVFSADSLRTFKEHIYQKTKDNKLEADITFENNSKDFYLSNKLSGKSGFNTNRTLGVLHDLSFSEKYDLPSHNLTNEFKLIIPRKKYRIEFDSFVQYNSLPDELQIEADSLYSFHIGLDGHIRQSVGIQNLSSDNSFNVVWQKKSWQIGQRIRLLQTSQSLTTTIDDRVLYV